jgi:hypothetical protein
VWILKLHSLKAEINLWHMCVYPREVFFFRETCLIDILASVIACSSSFWAPIWAWNATSPFIPDLWHLGHDHFLPIL